MLAVAPSFKSILVSERVNQLEPVDDDELMMMLMFQTSSFDGGGTDDAVGLSNGLDHGSVATSSQSVANNVDGFNSSTTVTVATVTITVVTALKRKKLPSIEVGPTALA